jgi:hypothetical protein
VFCASGKILLFVVQEVINVTAFVHLNRFVIAVLKLIINKLVMLKL